MSLYTFGHCIICFKYNENANLEEEGTTRKGTHQEVAKRFIVLASRYLDLRKDVTFPIERVLRSKSLWNIERACSSCKEMLESFCDIYHQIEYLKLQLDYRTTEIGKMIDFADKYDIASIHGRAELEKKVSKLKYPSTLEGVDNFRSAFVRKSSDRYGKRKLAPQIVLKNGVCTQDDSEHPDFYQEVRVVKMKKYASMPKTVRNNDAEYKHDSQLVRPTSFLGDNSANPTTKYPKTNDPEYKRLSTRKKANLVSSSNTVPLNGSDQRSNFSKQSDFPVGPPTHFTKAVSDEICSSSLDVADFNTDTCLAYVRHGETEKSTSFPPLNRQIHPPQLDWPLPSLNYFCPEVNCTQTFTTAKELMVHQQKKGHFKSNKWKMY